MGEMKHTPGPWSVEDPMGDDEATIVPANAPPHDWAFIASIGLGGRLETGLPRQEAMANARLIAAAPDALEVCRILDDAVKEGHDTVGGLVTHMLEAAEKARAVIAKVEGRMPLPPPPEGRDAE